MKTTARCLSVLLLASGLMLGACGGDDAAEPESTGDTGGEHDGEGSGDAPDGDHPDGDGADTDGTGGDTGGGETGGGDTGGGDTGGDGAGAEGGGAE